MTVARRYLWLFAMAFGLALIAMGIFFVVAGMDAKAEIRAGLQAEQITTSKDAVIPGVLVTDAETARAQAGAIKLHTLGRYGPYSGMDREDPNRDTYLKGVTLRTALNLAAIGMGVGDLAIGTGAALILIGAVTVGVGVPALYWAKQAERRVVREVSLQISEGHTPAPAPG